MASPQQKRSTQSKKNRSKSNATAISLATLFVTAGGVLAAWLAIPAFHKSEPPTPSISTGPISAGDCLQVGGNNNSCTVQQQADEVSRNTADAAQLKQLVEGFSQDPPQPPGPWPFLVYNTRVASGQDVGLKVKSAPAADGLPIGTATSRSLVWADCYVVNDYNPEEHSDVDVGPKWLRIHWPSSFPSTDIAMSSPTNRYLGYVYAGYGLPFKHNGSIPACR